MTSQARFYRGVLLADGRIACLAEAAPTPARSDVGAAQLFLFNPVTESFEPLGRLEWNAVAITPWQDGFAILGYQCEIYLWRPGSGGVQEAIDVVIATGSGICAAGETLYAVGTATGVFRRNAPGSWELLAPPDAVTLAEYMARLRAVGRLSSYSSFEDYAAAQTKAREGFSSLVTVLSTRSGLVLAGGDWGVLYAYDGTGWTKHQVGPTDAIAGLRQLSDGRIAFLTRARGWSINVGPETGPFNVISRLPESQTATSLAEIDGQLYFTTLDGAFRIAPDGNNRIATRQAESWALIATPRAWFVIQSDGILRLGEGSERLIPAPVL